MGGETKDQTRPLSLEKLGHIQEVLLANFNAAAHKPENALVLSSVARAIAAIDERIAAQQPNPAKGLSGGPA